MLGALSPSPSPRPQGTGPAPARSPSCLLLPGYPCTWVRNGQFELQHDHKQTTPGPWLRPVLSAAGQNPAQQMPLALFGWLTVVAGDPKQRDTAQAVQPGSPSVTRTRATPASGLDAYTSGGWAVPAPLTSLHTGQAQGGPGAGPGLAEGAEDALESRPLSPAVCCPSLPPTPQSACLLRAVRPHRVRQGLPEASRPLGPSYPGQKGLTCAFAHLLPLGPPLTISGICGFPVQCLRSETSSLLASQEPLWPRTETLWQSGPPF